MQFTTFATLFTAAAVLGAPTEPTKSMSIAALGETVFDQGDGFYLASYNDAGALKVNFTPMAELDTTTPPAEHLTTRSTHLLSKRETVCSGRTSVNLGNLDAANVQLAKNAAAQVTYNGGAWGWVSFPFVFNKHIMIITAWKYRFIMVARPPTSATTRQTI